MNREWDEEHEQAKQKNVSPFFLTFCHLELKYGGSVSVCRAAQWEMFELMKMVTFFYSHLMV